MPKSRSEKYLDDRNNKNQPLDDNGSFDDDLLMEHILQTISSTPIGQVLKKIASLPEVSQKKVMNVRRQLSQGSYDLNERLDIALEKVLSELGE